MKKLISKICEIKIVRKCLDNEAFVQFIKFGIVGFSNTVLSYLIYLFVLWALKSFGWHFDYVIANIAGFVISVAWSFFWNSKYVFKEKEGTQRVWWKALVKTYVSYSFSGLVVDNFLAILLVDLFGVPKLIAPIICLLITVPLNFVMNKFWAFRDKKDKALDGNNGSET